MIDQVILVVNLKYHMMSPSEFEHGDKQKIWSHNQTKLESEQAKNSAHSFTYRRSRAILSQNASKAKSKSEEERNSRQIAINKVSNS